MFPVRFPSMICQWNMSWAEITPVRNASGPPCFPAGEQGPQKHFLSSRTICSWRLGLPTFCKMAAAGEKPGGGV